jgi:hypothetical protein
VSQICVELVCEPNYPLHLNYFIDLNYVYFGWGSFYSHLCINMFIFCLISCAWHAPVGRKRCNLQHSVKFCFLLFTTCCNLLRLVKAKLVLRVVSSKSKIHPGCLNLSPLPASVTVHKNI